MPAKWPTRRARAAAAPGTASAREHGERVVPRIQVAHRLGAVLLGRVAVRGDLTPQLRIADLLAPALREADEETLIAGQSILHGVGFAVERETIGVVRRQQAGHVGDILAERLVRRSPQDRETAGTRRTAQRAPRPAALKCSKSSLVHQFASRPSASNWLPWSSKLWLISWPMIAPMEP